jgi:hypothetical protein
LEERVSTLEESSQLLGSKLEDQYQTKVEAASKYHMRLSGIVLLNLFSNRGYIDSQDVPTWAIPEIPNVSGQTFGASLRQSEIGLEVFGPHFAGARTSGNLQLDFAGGSPNTPNGVNFGLARLRIASVRMDWKNTSIVGGQDNSFFSPLSPTSFATLAMPAFSYAGNLWGWIPQLRIEHVLGCRKARASQCRVASWTTSPGNCRPRSRLSPRPETVPVNPRTLHAPRGRATFSVCL